MTFIFCPIKFLPLGDRLFLKHRTPLFIYRYIRTSISIKNNYYFNHDQCTSSTDVCNDILLSVTCILSGIYKHIGSTLSSMSDEI